MKTFREIIQLPRVDYPDWNEVDKNDPTKKQIRYWINKNRLLDESNSKFYYPYATGVKTGYTSHSRNCLVSSASKNGMDLIAVVLKSTKEGQYTDSIKLFGLWVQQLRCTPAAGTRAGCNCHPGSQP